MCGRKQCQALQWEHLVSAEPGPTEAMARKPVQERFPSSLEPKNQSTDSGVQGSQLVPHEVFLWRLQDRQAPGAPVLSLSQEGWIA